MEWILQNSIIDKMDRNTTQDMQNNHTFWPRMTISMHARVKLIMQMRTIIHPTVTNPLMMASTIARSRGRALAIRRFRRRRTRRNMKNGKTPEREVGNRATMVKITIKKSNVFHEPLSGSTKKNKGSLPSATSFTTNSNVKSTYGSSKEIMPHMFLK